MARLDRSIAALLVVGGIVSLTGCGQARRHDIPHDAPSGGQTLSEMRAAVSDIPGLSIDVGGGEGPNVKGNTGYDIAVTVSPGYRIMDGSALVTFLTESAWSVREGYMPNAQISITVKDDAGSGFDAAAAAAAGGWIEPRAPVPDSHGFTVVNVNVRDGSPARQRLGDWPGDVPAVPTDVTAAK
ncbi:hypothetical protein QE370_003300 [Aeromicrobium sp. SORGH_AS981]|uniref:hypothetical protein n=1 Tax=Aeromicrobium sp. SORGH_AS_0981 TaxID=3041802 RepID=UPI00285FEF68|nr:hypothetical protein [Aeromicrobium sp. SORGH_AS_0981]MDR6120116.1 hypothetical protein [Aeromicrobium sp. SORGH_AS_0981]